VLASRWFVGGGAIFVGGIGLNGRSGFAHCRSFTGLNAPPESCQSATDPIADVDGQVHISTVLRLFDRYRRYLIAKAQSAKPNYLSKIQWLSAPWIAFSLLAALICWSFNLGGTTTLYVTIPLVGINLFGIAYVFTSCCDMGSWRTTKRQSETNDHDNSRRPLSTQLRPVGHRPTHLQSYAASLA
jgi:hypothetical protein